jgi:hypothetical protein
LTGLSAFWEVPRAAPCGCRARHTLPARPAPFDKEDVLRNVFVAALVATGLAWNAPARAQAFGQYTGAEPLAVNGRLFGGYLHSSENAFGLIGQLRLSFYPDVDFGFQGGLTRQDLVRNKATTLRLGGDIKVGISKPTEQLPMAIALGGNFGVETGDEFNVLTVGANAVGSRTFPVGENSSVTPYGRIGFALSRFDVAGVDETDFSVPIRVGGDFRLSSALGLMLELQLQVADSFNDNVGIAAGVNLPF